MLEYLKLTTPKLIKSTIICISIFYFVLVCLLLVLAIGKNDFKTFFTLEAVTVYATVYAIGLSLFIMALAFYTEFNEYKTQQNLFSRKPFSQLNEIGFTMVELFKNTVWKLYQVVWATQLNGYKIVANMHTVNRVGVTILTSNSREILKIDKAVFNQ